MKCTDNYSDQTKAKIDQKKTTTYFPIFHNIFNYSSRNLQAPFFGFFPILTWSSCWSYKICKSIITIWRLENLILVYSYSEILLHHYLNTCVADLFQGYVEKLQIELQRCQENYLDAMDKCSVLEEELNSCKDKLSLYEQDDLGTVLVTLI